jgi:hypothetical protein
MYVVYQHRRKDNNIIFYVGQGVLKRAYEDIKNRRNEEWIRVVKEAGGFEVDILVEGLTRDESLSIEAEYIKKYGTIKHGTGLLVNERLSGTRGSESGYKHSEEKKREIREKTKEAMKDPEVHKRLIESHVAYWSTPESRVKASNAMKGLMLGEKHPQAKAIIQYSIDGKFIKNWPYARLAAKELSISASSICLCCQGKKEDYKGFRWSYANTKLKTDTRNEN